MKRSKKKNDHILYFTLFVIISAILVLILEYNDALVGERNPFPIDSQRRVQNMTEKSKMSERPQLDLTSLISDDVDLIDQFIDKNQVEHIVIKTTETFIDVFRNRLKTWLAKAGYNPILKEIKKTASGYIFLFNVINSKKKLEKIILIYADQKPIPITSEIPSTSESLTTKRVCIIIDDIGSKPNIIVRLSRLNIPITASILTDEPFAKEEAQAAQTHSIETILHIPMEPNNGSTNKNQNVITPDSTGNDIKQILNKALKIVPHAKGLNNHQGSLVTSDKETMTKVLQIVKTQGLFFIDSRTSVDSLAYQLAKEFNIKTAYKDLFLDHIQTYDHTVEQLNRLRDLLKKKDSAILIGHPHDSTMRALHDQIPLLLREKIVFVYVKELLH